MAHNAAMKAPARTRSAAGSVHFSLVSGSGALGCQHHGLLAASQTRPNRPSGPAARLSVFAFISRATRNTEYLSRAVQEPRKDKAESARGLRLLRRRVRPVGFQSLNRRKSQKATAMAAPIPKDQNPRCSNATANSCFSGGARKAMTSAITPKMIKTTAMKTTSTAYSEGVVSLDGIGNRITCRWSGSAVLGLLDRRIRLAEIKRPSPTTGITFSFAGGPRATSCRPTLTKPLASRPQLEHLAAPQDFREGGGYDLVFTPLGLLSCATPGQ